MSAREFTRDLAVDYDTDLFATQKCRAEDAEHIASWHPVVALAVADWLEVVANRWGWNGTVTRERACALKVADAYLGVTS